MGTKTIALARRYAADPTKVESDIESRKSFVEQMRSMAIDHVRFLVWKNDEYPDTDCGLSHDALVRAHHGDDFVSVRTCGRDPFAGVINTQAEDASLKAFDWVLVISPTSGHMLTERVMASVRIAMQDPTIDTIAVVPPDVPSVANGAVTNQVAFWRRSFLDMIGWFDLIDARPIIFDYEVNHQGVGELINPFKSANPHPVAIVYPDVEEGDVRTATADPRQAKKLAHKERRIKLVLAMIGKTEDDLRRLINPAHVYDLRSAA